MTHFACVPTSRVRAPRPIALALACLALAGCDIDARIAVADGGPVPGCVGTRAEVDIASYQRGAACPDTYDAALRAPPTCSALPASTQTSSATCGSARVLFTLCGSLHGFYCAYDPAGRLAGQIALDDSPSYCGRTSSCIQYGAPIDGLACRNGDVVSSCGFSPLTAPGDASVDAGAPTACGATPPFECDHATDGVCGDSSTWPTCTGGVWSCPAGSIRPSACRCTFTQGCACGTSPCADAGVDAGLSFPCGELRCDPGTQFCRGVSSSAATRRITYSCEALPTACGGAANCACVVPRETAGAACQEYSDGAVHVSLYTP
ncbi:MAG: hypothetical protein IPF99_14305 [Deltaproteobacteria bacterium]|nr:hypothetical protein [Deltaproteobacteria bacterium]MBP6834138.1 hypothetical protein [Deltaproteobacteria bacterium]